MRKSILLVLTAWVPLAAGCTIPREIQPVQPPPQPHLMQLEQHLTYVDPDAGEPDYVIIESR